MSISCIYTVYFYHLKNGSINFNKIVHTDVCLLDVVLLVKFTYNVKFAVKNNFFRKMILKFTNV